MFRRTRRDPLAEVRPHELGARWAAPLEAALAARHRFVTVVSGIEPGAARTRLDELASETDGALGAAWTQARHARDTELTVSELDIVAAGDRLKVARRNLATCREQGKSGSELAVARATVEREADRFATLNRVVNELDDIAERLGRLAPDIDAASSDAAEIRLMHAANEPSVETVALRVSALRGAFSELR